MTFNPQTSEDVQRNIDATSDEWKAEYERLCIQLCHEEEIFDGSRLCAYARKHGLGEPHTHNSWVAMVMAMQKKGYITRVKEGNRPVFVAGTGSHSHNNNVSLWMSNLYKKG